MRHTGGWIKLHRKIGSNWVGNDAASLSVWVTLLLWALHEESEIMTREGPVKLYPGQIVTSSLEIAEALGVNRKTVERRLKWLENSKMIDQQTSNRGRIITVKNWEAYQEKQKDVSSKNPTEGTPEYPTEGTAGGALNGEDKEDKEVKKNIPPKRGRSGVTPSEFDIQLANEWHEWTKSRIKTFNANLTTSSDTIRKLRTNEKLTEEQIRNIFEFVKNDDWWPKRAQSPASLLNRGKNDLRKFENIQEAMEKEKPKKNGLEIWKEQREKERQKNVGI